MRLLGRADRMSECVKQVPIPTELQGHIAELRDQIQVLSERAAAKTAEVYALRREIERLKVKGIVFAELGS